MSSVKFPALDGRAAPANLTTNASAVSGSQSARGTADAGRRSRHSSSGKQMEHAAADAYARGNPIAAAPASHSRSDSPHRQSREYDESGALRSDGGSGPVESTLPLSQQVAAALAAASSHERSILKWARDIQREVDEYKAGIMADKAKAANGSNTGRQQGRTRERNAAAGAHTARLAAIEPVGQSSTASHSPPRRGAGVQRNVGGAHSLGARMRDTIFGGSMGGGGTGGLSVGFLRDDIQSIHPRGRGLYTTTTHLAKLHSAHGGGSQSARELSTPSAASSDIASSRSHQHSLGNAALYHHRATVQARQKAAAEAAAAKAAAEDEAAHISAHGVSRSEQSKAQAIADIFGATANATAVTTANPNSVLQSLPPSLAGAVPPAAHAHGAPASASDLSVAHDHLDSAASFKSPALYIDLQMRHLFHPDSVPPAPTAAVGAHGNRVGDASHSSLPLSSSQKAHVVLHLVDVLGLLVEPDSQAAYRALSDTLKELVLAGDYKNLIPTAQANGTTSTREGHSRSHANTHTPAAAAAALKAAQHREMLRARKAQWDAQGLAREPGASLWDHKSLAESLKDGSMDRVPTGGAALQANSRQARQEQARENERQALARQQAAAAADGESDIFSDSQSDAQSRRKAPTIVFEPDYAEGSVAASHLSALAASVAPGAVVPFRPKSAPMVRASPAWLSSVKQVPASQLEVAWTLRAELASLCHRLDTLHAATGALAAEGERLGLEHSFLHQWSTKKSLQLSLYSRSDTALRNEIAIIQHLLADLRDEHEQLTEQNLAGEQEYLARGLVFGGAFALDASRAEEESRNYPSELRAARRQMDASLARIDCLKKELASIHGERDLLLTRIEVLEQAVNMMHNEEDDEEEEEEEDGGANGGTDGSTRPVPAPLAAPPDLSGYPFVQQRPTDLRGRGASNLSVPPILRFDGWFPLLPLTTQDVEVRVKELWSLKTIADSRAKQVGATQTTLAHFLDEYFTKRFVRGQGQHDVIARAAAAADPSDTEVANRAALALYPLREFVLNFFVVLERGAAGRRPDQDFVLFLRVVHNRLHEAHYRDHMNMLAHFKEAMVTWDSSEHIAQQQLAGGAGAGAGAGAGSAQSASCPSPSSPLVIDGLISRPTFLAGLRSFFPHKSPAHHAELIEVLERDFMVPAPPGYASANTAELFVDARRILAAAGDGGIEGGGGAGGREDEHTHASTDGAVSDASAPTSGPAPPINFLECIRAQYLSEIEAFVSRIRRDLYALHTQRASERARATAATDENATAYSAASASSRAATAWLSAKDVRTVLRGADPHRSSEELTDMLKRGCNEPYLSKDTEVPIEQFMSNLVQSGLVHFTDHWCRVAPHSNSTTSSERSTDRAAQLAQEERKAALADAHPLAGTAGRRPTGRRTSMDDEAVYLAARAAGGQLRMR